MRRLARLVGMTGVAIGWIAAMPGVAIGGIAALLLDWGEDCPRSLNAPSHAPGDSRG